MKFRFGIFSGPGKPAALDRINPTQRSPFQRTRLSTALDSPARFGFAIDERTVFLHFQSHLLR
jgi:hypothetical protein